MDQQWLANTIDELRQIGNDTQRCEVKESVQKLPASIKETLSAFSNGQGGYILLGISEKNGFTPAPGFDARRMQDALSSACEEMTPIVRPEIAVLPFEGSQILCAKVSEMHPRDKPCYITVNNRYNGSYVRTGDGDRRLSAYEIDRLMEEHKQPIYDNELVVEATLEDLDPELVAGFVRRQKDMHPRILGAKTASNVLLDLHVVRQDGDILRPTLAGLMAMGMFPQKFFPRLNVTFTVFPGVTKTTRVDDRRRFLDARTIIGSIPVMIADTLDAVSQNMRTGAIIEGAFRQDVPDYPPTAVREAIANALMHRDYSPEARGSQVQVNMYADRLEVLNPGGLYGDVTIDTLGESGVSSTRNQFLSNILETTPFPDGGYVVENRGTGYQEIEEQLHRAMMYPPRPRNSMVAFSLTIDKRRMDASEKRGTDARNVREAILDYLDAHSSASTRDLVEASGMSRTTITKNINTLIDEGEIEPTEPVRSPKQRYRRVRTQ